MAISLTEDDGWMLVATLAEPSEYNTWPSPVVWTRSPASLRTIWLQGRGTVL